MNVVVPVRSILREQSQPTIDAYCFSLILKIQMKIFPANITAVMNVKTDLRQAMIKVIVDYLTNPKEGGRYKVYLPKEFGKTIFTNNKVGEITVIEFADAINEWYDQWERPINYSTDHITKEVKYFGRKCKGSKRLTIMTTEQNVQTALNKLKEKYK